MVSGHLLLVSGTAWHSHRREISSFSLTGVQYTKMIQEFLEAAYSVYTDTVCHHHVSSTRNPMRNNSYFSYSHLPDNWLKGLRMWTSSLGAGYNLQCYCSCLTALAFIHISWEMLLCPCLAFSLFTYFLKSLLSFWENIIFRALALSSRCKMLWTWDSLKLLDKNCLLQQQDHSN